ncbi:MAG TPA: DUF1467 family protein [Stellaceae bacterium]|jgi:predicted secreted protein
MNWVSGIVVYVCVWWVVLFAVLPWGATPPDTPERGHDAGAPARPRLWLKAGVTTAISLAIWLGIYALVVSDLISFRE